VRFEPGESKTVALVAIAGKKVIRGGNALADGPVNEKNKKRTMAAIKAQGFGNQEGGK
jgi:urease subunit gamma/beta